MPSPIGHAVAGLIVGLAGERRAEAAPWWLFFTCMLLAAAPDLDYIYPPIHRGPTHSVSATVVITLAAALISRLATGRTRWGLAIICGLAHFSHIAVDWLGEDQTVRPGLQILWPFSDRLFISGWDLFRSTKRIDPFVTPQFEHNFRTLVQEMVLLGPALIWLIWRRSARSRH